MNITKYIITAHILMMFSHLHGQPNLDQYIQQGLEDNEVIKQQQFLLDKSLYALKEAKTLFLPNFTLNGSYTLADGGRTIDLPLGDLFNPIYNSLNQASGSTKFTPLENQSILLNPDNFYDAKIRTTLPIINAELIYNQKIKRQQISLQEIEVAIYKRELVRDIKTSYFKYLQATQAVNIYRSALRIVQENLRINKSLLNNQKANRTTVIRSESEVARYEALITSSNQSKINAAAYFNFLLNRDLSAQILEDSITNIPNTYTTEQSSSNREEMQKLQTVRDTKASLIGLARSYQVPKLNAFLDMGSQGFDFEFNTNKTRYYFFGVSLEWNLFAWNKNRYKVRQAESDAAVTQSQTSYVEKQLQLQLSTATNSFNASVSLYESAAYQAMALKKYHADILRSYKETQALFIEVLDAQNQWISAELQATIARYDVWINAAEVERANASFILN